MDKRLHLRYVVVTGDALAPFGSLRPIAAFYNEPPAIRYADELNTDPAIQETYVVEEWPTTFDELVEREAEEELRRG